jgi:hypothetical protein
MSRATLRLKHGSVAQSLRRSEAVAVRELETLGRACAGRRTRTCFRGVGAGSDGLVVQARAGSGALWPLIRASGPESVECMARGRASTRRAATP